MNRWRDCLGRMVAAWCLSGAVSSALPAQSEADRPVGEVTREMLEQVGARRDGARKIPGIPWNVVPTPQETYWSDKVFDLGPRDALRYTVEAPRGEDDLRLLGREFARRLTDRFGARKGAQSGGVRIVFSLDAGRLPVASKHVARTLQTLKDRSQGYVLKCVREGGHDSILIAGNSKAALWHGMVTLAQMVVSDQGHLKVPAVEIIDYPHFERRGLLVDIGGQGFMIGPSKWKLARWKQFIDWMVDHKMNEVWFEIIGSGRLMGNLDVEQGEWIGFPVDLKPYPQLVAKNRPFRRWDETLRRVVNDRYTAPNVEREFLHELIDYGKARGVRCSLLIGYDYFANQLPVVLGVPANDPTDKAANRVYDEILREIVASYRNASEIVLITIENKHVPPEMVDHVTRRVREAKQIIHAIDPTLKVGVLNDYLEWWPREEVERFAELISGDAFDEIGQEEKGGSAG